MTHETTIIENTEVLDTFLANEIARLTAARRAINEAKAALLQQGPAPAAKVPATSGPLKIKRTRQYRRVKARMSAAQRVEVISHWLLANGPQETKAIIEALPDFPPPTVYALLKRFTQKFFKDDKGRWNAIQLQPRTLSANT